MTDPRSDLGSWLRGLQAEGKLEALFTQILFAEGKKKGYAEFNCKKCGQRQRQEAEVDVPAAKPSELAKAFQILMDQAYGKPAETKKVDVDITVSTIEGFKALTNAELAQLAAIEDADFRELPPGD